MGNNLKNLFAPVIYCPHAKYSLKGLKYKVIFIQTSLTEVIKVTGDAYFTFTYIVDYSINWITIMQKKMKKKKDKNEEPQHNINKLELD